MVEDTVFYFMEVKTMRIWAANKTALHPLRRAIPIQAKDWETAKKKAVRHQVYRNSLLYIGTAVTQNGCIDTSKEYIFCDGKGWHMGKTE